YPVVIPNVQGSTTSAPVVLAFRPSILTLDPTNQSVAQGDTALVTITATGNPTLSYSWRSNGVVIPDATSSTFTLDDIQATTTAFVVVTNGFGAATSSVAIITFFSPPSIITPPANVTANAGGSATFTVAASGTAPLDYQWRFNGGNIPGANASTYTRANLTASDAGSYDVVVT